MAGLKSRLRRLTKLRGVPEARHVAERAVAPYLRHDLHSLNLDHVALAQRIENVERVVAATDERTSSQIAGMANAIEQIERHQPAVLNAIASVNGTVRILRRELEAGDANVLAEIRPHLDTLRWLVERVELVRAEMMNELRYGPGSGGAQPGEVGSSPARIVNADALTSGGGELRVNLGAGHIPLAGFVNVDARELPGIDVVANVDDLPFEPASLTEIFSAHTLEHFPHEELRRRLLPYWVGLLRPGGTFRAVVPDMEAMTKEYSKGAMTFETLRNVAYGGQEYAGDFHFTGFTPGSLSALLESMGLVDARVVANGRVNGDCLECEVVATRPQSAEPPPRT